MIKVTKENQDELIKNYVEIIVDSMDVDALVQLAIETITDNLYEYDLKNLEKLLNEYYGG